MHALLVVVLLGLSLPAWARCPATATTEAFLEAGRFDVGVRTLHLEDTSRTTPAHGASPELPSRQLTTEVWYPVRRGTTGPEPPLARGGPFPLIVNSHGLMDFRTGEGYVAAHLASRGFIVASPDFPLTNLGTPGGPLLDDLHNQPGDVSFIIDAILAEARLRGSWLRGGVRRRRIGAMGLSYGGATTLLVTYHPTLRDPRIRAAMPLAPLACGFGAAFYQEARVPLLLVQGDEDIVLPLAANGRRAFDLALRSPRTLITLERGTHTAFSGPITAPRETSYDEVACGVLVGVETRGNPVTGLGGAENGVDIAGCGLPCQDPLPDHPPMAAGRQHDLTRAAAAAFFESTLGGSAAGRCFLREQLAAENDDLLVESAKGKR